MILAIDTAVRDQITVRLLSGRKHIAARSVPAAHAQAEKLLPLIEALLKKQRLRLGNIKNIVVQDAGEGFTSLRIGIITANALAYALGIPVLPASGRPLKKKGIRVVAPRYAAPPSITKKA